MANYYDKGATIRVSFEIRDVNGTLFDPTTVTLTFKKPTGTKIIHVYGVSTDLLWLSTGKYQIDFIGDTSGQWHIKVSTTGPVHSEESLLYISRSQF